MKGTSEIKIQTLKQEFSKLQKIDTGQVTLEQTTELQSALDKTRGTLDKYTEAVDRCQALEGGEHDPKNKHVIEQMEMEDELDTLEYKIEALKARVKEERNAKVRAEASTQGRTHEQQGNMGRVVAKPPPPMEKDITLDELETWSSTWDDYYQVTKLEKEVPTIQRANLKSHLSQEMRAVVEHVLEIGQNSTMTCAEIIQEIKAYIRSNRNIQIDKVSFEKRTQKQGESFNDYLVAIRKMARNADLCKHCLDDRLLTKIMAGVSDQETREELLARVPTPKLEEAITFARSKEAARRSNMDLNGRVVQQVRGRDSLPSRSEYPRSSWRGSPHPRRGSPRRFQHDQSWGRPRRDTSGNDCYFCGRDDCFARDDHGKCPAFGQQCQQCRGQDHFEGTVACKRGYRREFPGSLRRDQS